jgi:molybdate transport system substrate-binding protein
MGGELRVLSAGAAQAVVEVIAADYQRETGRRVRGEFGAVGAIRQKLVDGAEADVIVLTGAMIDELVASGHVSRGSRADLGKVGTGIAVRAGTPVPDVSTAQKLRDRLLGATCVACPDPAIATAGKVVVQMLERLNVTGAVTPRLQHFPNGYAAMKWLAESRGRDEVGITQITEILANPGVTLVAPLPGDLQVRTLYAAGLAARSTDGEAAQEFLARLTAAGARKVLAKAGYEFDN